MEDNYESIVTEIDSISSSVIPIEETIHISGILQAYPSTVQFKYDDAVSIMEGLGGPEIQVEIKKPEPEKPKPKVTVSPSPPRTVHIRENIERAAKDLTTKVPKPTAKPVIVPQQKPKPAKMEKPKREKTEHVMRTLSIQDQIAEMEKISLGLEQNVFDQEQLSIIKGELLDLKDSILKKELVGVPSELLELRKERLDELLGKLGI